MALLTVVYILSQMLGLALGTYLMKFGLRMDDLYAKMAAIPDFSTLLKTLKDLEKRMADSEKKIIL